MENIKYKYIFYNEKKEILIFNRCENRFFIPGVIKNQKLDSYGEVIKLTVDELVMNRELMELGNAVEKYNVFQTKNRKLYKTFLEEKKYYFSCYCEFTKEYCDKIMELYYKTGLVPNLIYIDDLIELVRRKNKVQIDKNLYNPLEELGKRLSYKKY